MKKQKKQQQRPNSSKAFTNKKQSHFNEKAVLNLTMKNYYQEYEKMKSLLKLPEQSLPIENYKISIKKMNELFNQWNEPTDFYSSFPVINSDTLYFKNKDKSILITKTNIKEDYLMRLRRYARKVEEQVNNNEDNEYAFEDNDNLLISEKNKENELNQLKETDFGISEEEEEYQYDFDEQNKNKGKSNNEDKDDNDEEEKVKGSNDHIENVEEEYKFDEEINKEGDQMMPISNHSNNDIDNNINESISEENNIEVKERDDQFKKERIDDYSPMSKSKEIEEDFNDKTKNNKEKNSEINQEQYSSSIHSNKNNTLHRIPAQKSQSSLQKFKNDFFEDTNDKVILDEFEKKVFDKQSNILQIDNNSISNEDGLYSEKRAIAIQRFWKKLKLNRILNFNRMKLAIEFDKKKKYAIFMYADKVNSQNKIECLFIRIYCIEKMKTLFDWFTIDDLINLEIINYDTNNNELSVSNFSEIKDKLKEKIVEVIIDHNIKKETEGKFHFKEIEN